MNDEKKSLSDALLDNLDGDAKERHEEIVLKEEEEARLELRAVDPENRDVVSDTEEDVAFVRDKLKGTITVAADSLESMKNLAEESEHPRTYEVLANMLKTVGELSKDLINIHERRVKVRHNGSLRQAKGEGDDEGGGTTIKQQNVFVGSTTDLQKMLAEAEKQNSMKKAEPVIEAEEIKNEHTD